MERGSCETVERATAEVMVLPKIIAGLTVNNCQIVIRLLMERYLKRKNSGSLIAELLLKPLRQTFSERLFYLHERDVGRMAVKAVVVGAMGRMGKEVVKTILASGDVVLVGAVDRASSGEDAGIGAGCAACGVAITSDLAATLASVKPNVIVDFTRPEVVMDNLRVSLAQGVSAVVGTTGFTPDNLTELDELAKKNHCGVLVAPNFSVGAVLMMKLATEAIRYMPKAEIIELHHDQKLDAPSGTASLTAERLAAARGGFLQQGHPNEKEKWSGARGASYEGIHVHSVRLPGYVAHQEVLFGGLGETLTIRHDSLSRESFMPGVLMACRKMENKVGLLYGLEQLMD